MFARMQFLRNWKFLASIVLPLLLLPLIFIGDSVEESKRFKGGYVIILMGIFWMFEIIPLSVTALFPLVLFPFFGIQTTGQVVGNYMKETQMMFIGGICLALGLQQCGLHKRIALRIMLVIGSSPWRLLLGVLVTTTLLSCVIIVNTAVAAMMAPIVAGLIDLIGDSVGDKQRRKLQIAFYLAVGYGANVGGTSTFIGSQTALIYKELIERENVGQNGTYTDLNFLTYSAFSMPLCVVSVFFIWGVLGFLYLGAPRISTGSGLDLVKKESESCEDVEIRADAKRNRLFTIHAVRESLRQKYYEMGPMGFTEYSVLALLTLAVSLWFTRDPHVFPGWMTYLPKTIIIGDATVGIAVLIVMFIIPRNLNCWKADYEGPRESLLTWEYVQFHFPWSVVFIVGGGLALSDGAAASGLSEWLGNELHSLQTLPNPVILLVLLITISIFTEFMSNTAVVSLLTPILLSLSKTLNLHPLYLSLPGSIASQYAFMLPTSNPPNAIVYSAGNMRILDMAVPGIILNFGCVILLYLTNLLWGNYVIFGYDNYSYPNL